MGTLKYITGDLFATDCEIIGHGVNILGAFGSGVAGQIRRMYPSVYNDYMHKYRTDGWEVGDVQYCPIDNGRQIVNMATQPTVGQPGLNVDYDGLEAAFVELFRYCQDAGLRIAIPKIGAGLGGGDWDIIEGILLKLLEEWSVDLNVYVL